MSRVPLHGKPNNFINVEPGATVGAKIGKKVLNADGSLFDPQTYVAQVIEAQTAGQGASPAGGSIVAWGSVQGVPANVKSAALVGGDGFLRRNGTTWTASPIVNADLSGATTAGLAEGANLYYTDGRADARVALAAPPLGSLFNAVDDAAAAVGGVPVGGRYRNGSVLMIRVA